jgi:AcrR family transcriptional regulator
MSTAQRDGRIGKRVAQGLRIRDKLLRVATQRFAEQGFSGTSVDDVCHDTGVVKSALYWHFENKDGLLTAVLEQAATALEQATEVWIQDIVRDAPETGDARERLHRAVGRLRGIVETQEGMIRLMHGIFLEGTSLSNKKRRAIVMRVYEHVRDALARGIAEVIGSHPPELEAIALLILAALNGLFVANQLRRTPDEIEKIFAELERTIFYLVSGVLQTTPGAA